MRFGELKSLLRPSKGSFEATVKQELEGWLDAIAGPHSLDCDISVDGRNLDVMEAFFLVPFNEREKEGFRQLMRYVGKRILLELLADMKDGGKQAGDVLSRMRRHAEIVSDTTLPVHDTIHAAVAYRVNSEPKILESSPAPQRNSVIPEFMRPGRYVNTRAFLEELLTTAFSVGEAGRWLIPLVQEEIESAHTSTPSRFSRTLSFMRSIVKPDEKHSEEADRSSGWLRRILRQYLAAVHSSTELTIEATMGDDRISSDQREVAIRDFKNELRASYENVHRLLEPYILAAEKGEAISATADEDTAEAWLARRLVMTIINVYQGLSVGNRSVLKKEFVDIARPLYVKALAGDQRNDF